MTAEIAAVDTEIQDYKGMRLIAIDFRGALPQLNLNFADAKIQQPKTSITYKLEKGTRIVE